MTDQMRADRFLIRQPALAIDAAAALREPVLAALPAGAR